MYYLLVAVHIVVCLFLILVVLLQTGKGAEMGAAFGGSAQTMFGSRGTVTLLSKLTTASAVIFMVTSLLLAVWSMRQTTVIPDIPAAAAPTGAPPTSEQPTGGSGQGPVSDGVPVTPPTETGGPVSAPAPESAPATTPPSAPAAPQETK